MNTEQLRCIISCDRVLSHRVSGVYASDNLPGRILLRTLPEGIVANSDSLNGRGKHWLALFVTRGKEGEFFCSFGYPIEHYSSHFKDYFTNLGIGRVTSNKAKLQSDSSNSCGYYSVYYLVHRCRDDVNVGHS